MITMKVVNDPVVRDNAGQYIHPLTEVVTLLAEQEPDKVTMPALLRTVLAIAGYNFEVLSIEDCPSNPEDTRIEDINDWYPTYPENKDSVLISLHYSEDGDMYAWFAVPI